MSIQLETQRQRLLMTAGLGFAVSLVLYVYIVEIAVLVGVLTCAWYLYDIIEEHTKECVDSSGKYVFITGCDSGLGLASAKAIRDLGFHVIAGCYDDQSSGAVELKALPWVRKVEVVAIDVTNEGSVSQAAKEVKDICGDQGLWAVINNAALNASGPAEITTMEFYHKVNEVNLFGAIRVTKALLPAVRLTEGRIVNVTSERAFNPRGGHSNYCISKFGLEAFSACLRQEMAEFNVKVVTVAPGNFSGSSALISEKMTEDLMDRLLQGHSQLCLQDQTSAYKKDAIEGLAEQAVQEMEKSSSDPGPVVRAYVDAVHNCRPKACYLVHGLRRQSWDGVILMARIRPYLPLCVSEYVEKVVNAIFL